MTDDLFSYNELHPRSLQYMFGVTILRLEVQKLSVASAIADAL